jgi:hypothetical protein
MQLSNAPVTGETSAAFVLQVGAWRKLQLVHTGYTPTSGAVEERRKLCSAKAAAKHRADADRQNVREPPSAPVDATRIAKIDWLRRSRERSELIVHADARNVVGEVA